MLSNLDRVVQNPQEIIGSCGLFVVRDYRTVSRPRRQSCYVDVRKRGLITMRLMLGFIELPQSRTVVLSVAM